MWHGIEMELSRRNQISTIEHTMDVLVTPQVNRSHDMVKMWYITGDLIVLITSNNVLDC